MKTSANIFYCLIAFLSIGWLLWRGLARNDDPKIVFKFIFSLALVTGEVLFVRGRFGKLQPGMGGFGDAFLMAVSLPVLGFILSVIWAPQMGGFLMGLLINVIGGKAPPECKPGYSLALEKRKRNQPLEAVVAIREHLAKTPDDFEGVMLLANIQADDLKDLRSAEITLRQFCELDNTPPRLAAAALIQLADWNLKFYQDTSPGKAVLQCIVDKYPGTESATAAQERLGRLGS